METLSDNWNVDLYKVQQGGRRHWKSSNATFGPAVVTFELCVQNLCHTRKIRYEMRKQLAQARPRVRGQFVKTALQSRGCSVAVPVTTSSAVTSCMASQVRACPGYLKPETSVNSHVSSRLLCPQARGRDAQTIHS